MVVMLQPGDVLTVQLMDSDGEFRIELDKDGDGHLRVVADMPNTNGREGVIYDEDFSIPPIDLIPALAAGKPS